MRIARRRLVPHRTPDERRHAGELLHVKKLGRIRGGAGAPVATAAWPTWRARRQLDHVHVCIDIPLRGRDAFFGIQGGRV